MTHQTPAVYPINLDHVPEIKLIACDMDGTLLDDDRAIHEDFWPLIDQLHARSIVFCAASGRQYYNLVECFKPIADKVIFIAENGSYVVRAGAEFSADCLARDIARELIRVTRDLQSSGADVGAVLCGKRSAYIERTDSVFLAEVVPYYHRLDRVGDLLAVKDDILKVAVFDFASSERISAPAFARYRDTHQVAISGPHWLDIMAPQANKGSGLRHIRGSFRVGEKSNDLSSTFLSSTA